MDTVTFELAPREVRVRAIAVVAASIGLVVIALLVGGRGHDPSSAGHLIASGLLMIFGVGLAIRLALVGITTFLGRPLVKRGLFRSKIKVAWKTHTGAQVFTAFVTALAIFTALDAPVRTSGLVFVGAAVVAHIALYLIASDRRLAAVQMWATPMAAPEPEPAQPPERVLRPMIDSPLPPPPRIVDDPFRAPPPTARLDDKLVKPALVTATPDVVATGNTDEPSFLR
jgi:hypothetical protein